MLAPNTGPMKRAWVECNALADSAGAALNTSVYPYDPKRMVNHHAGGFLT